MQVCELIWITVDPADSTPISSMQPLAQRIVPMVMALRPRFAVAARTFKAGVCVRGACLVASASLSCELLALGCMGMGWQVLNT